MPSPAYRSSTANQADSTATVTITKPTGVVDGDLLVAVINLHVFSGAPTVSAAPSGWTLLSPSPLITATNICRSYVYWKVAASEGTSWSWTLSGSGFFAWVCVAVQDPGGATPIADGQGQVDADGNTSATAPSVTTTATDNLLMYIHARKTTTADLTAPSGFTVRAGARNGSTDAYVAAATKAPAGAVGATGTVSGTTGGTQPSMNYLIAVGAASAATTFVPLIIATY